jgi:hypothetical protein
VRQQLAESFEIVVKLGMEYRKGFFFFFFF